MAELNEPRQFTNVMVLILEHEIDRLVQLSERARRLRGAKTRAEEPVAIAMQNDLAAAEILFGTMAEAVAAVIREMKRLPPLEIEDVDAEILDVLLRKAAPSA